MTEGARPAKIYLDSNALIYFIERADERQRRIGQFLAGAIEGGTTVVVSEVGIAECLYGAYKMNSSALEARYNEIFYDIALFEIAPVDHERLKAAARIGARKGLKLVDALHFVAAIETRCAQFLTNDARIRSSDGIEVVAVARL